MYGFKKYREIDMSRNVTIINYVVIGVLVILNGFSCIYFFNANNTESVFENNIMKVVEIKTTNDENTWGYATGFFINNNGTILTNKHVVYNASTNSNYDKIQVRSADMDEWVNAQIFKVSETSDLAIIKIEKEKTPFFKIGKNIFNGQTIYTIGNPSGFGLSFTTGVVSSSEKNVIYNEQTIQTIQTSFVINEGNSGGPVFDKYGNLLGVISFRLRDNNGEVIQGVSFALPFSTINAFVQN